MRMKEAMGALAEGHVVDVSALVPVGKSSGGETSPRDRTERTVSLG